MLQHHLPRRANRLGTLRSPWHDSAKAVDAGSDGARIFLAYNLVRLEMERTVGDLGIEPTRISLVSALRIVCDTWSWCALASPGALPVRLKAIRDLFSRLVLPERRRSRRYPRAVKIKMSNFPRKRPPHAAP